VARDGQQPPDRPAEAPSRADPGTYWDTIAGSWVRNGYPAWRLQSDLVHTGLVERWLPRGLSRVLKTDLFDEHVGEGLVPALRRRAERVTAVDVSPAIVDAVRSRYGTIDAVTADVRKLPFDADLFDAVLSNSTLDHFEDRAQVVSALRELARVVKPGGRLILTLDNPLHPLVALRNLLPSGAARAIRRVEYEIGWTCGPRGLRRLLAETGFQTRELTAVLHLPRVLVAQLGEVEVGGARARTARALYAGERLERLPTRYLTGHYVAALATRR
jgi:SAM-dependent methyltransferase